MDRNADRAHTVAKIPVIEAVELARVSQHIQARRVRRALKDGMGNIAHKRVDRIANHVWKKTLVFPAHKGFMDLFAVMYARIIA